MDKETLKSPIHAYQRIASKRLKIGSFTSFSDSVNSGSPRLLCTLSFSATSLFAYAQWFLNRKFSDQATLNLSAPTMHSIESTSHALFFNLFFSHRILNNNSCTLTTNHARLTEEYYVPNTMSTINCFKSARYSSYLLTRITTFFFHNFYSISSLLITSYRFINSSH